MTGGRNQMRRRAIASFGMLLLAGIVSAPLATRSETGQAATSAKAAPSAKKWTLPHTSDGQPDLQGYWTNSTYTPLERPKNVTKEFYTREEALEIVKRQAVEEAEQTQPGTIPDVHY